MLAILSIDLIRSQIMRKISREDRREALHRLGPLNVYNPIDPDEEYELFLADHDDREMCKILVALAMAEPVSIIYKTH